MESEDRFGRLVVTARDGTRWTCRCDCGTEKVYPRKAILRPDGKATRSCGCGQREAAARTGRTKNRTHGMKNTPTYRTWISMRNRCANPANAAYSKYGGRGITVDPRWDSFEVFLADMGERPAGQTIDRIDVNAGYSPTNCRWATDKEQGRNRRSNTMFDYGGDILTLAEAAERSGVPRSTIGKRLEAGWSVERALHTPVDTSKRASTYRRTPMSERA